MEGDMRESPLSEILQFISLGSRSGTLEIVRRGGVHGIIFTAGTITGLTSDGWSLAQQLRDAQLLPSNVLTDLLAADANVSSLRAAVLTGGYMTADECTAFVSRQVERLLYALFDVREGTFKFRQAAPPAGEWLPVRVAADRAVLEGTRWSESWGRASETIPSRRSRFARTHRTPCGPVSLSPTQWRVFVATETIGSLPLIAARSVLAEVDVIESLQTLMEIGLVQRVDDGPPPLATGL